MSARRARLVLLVSTISLVALGFTWFGTSASDPRADLAGQEVRVTATSALPTSTSTTSTTTTPSTSAPPNTADAAAVEPAGAQGMSAPAPTVVAPPDPPPARLSFGPRALSIPALGVDAPVVPVGLEPDGKMEVPGAAEAGWYVHGRRPGYPLGSAVIAAHVDYGGREGVFFDLRYLEAGSEVSVTGEDGEIHRYVVTERFQVGKEQLPIDELFRMGGAPTLTLITCGGAFDQGARHYTDNIVVRAVPV